MVSTPEKKEKHNYICVRLESIAVLGLHLHVRCNECCLRSASATAHHAGLQLPKPRA